MEKRPHFLTDTRMYKHKRYELSRTNKRERAAARAAGQPTYTSSLWCVYNHDPLRRTDDGKCIHCNSADTLALERKRARAAGPMTYEAAREQFMMFFLPLREDQAMLCPELHDCLWRVGKTWPICMSCTVNKSRAKARERKALQKKIDFLS